MKVRKVQGVKEALPCLIPREFGVQCVFLTRLVFEGITSEDIDEVGSAGTPPALLRMLRGGREVSSRLDKLSSYTDVEAGVAPRHSIVCLSRAK